jgi:pyruvate carboxylase
VEAIIDAAHAAGADAVYQGYGFLSENPDLAAACARADITFVGPSAQVLELTGNKARAIAAAKAAGLPVLASSKPSTDIDTLMGRQSR